MISAHERSDLIHIMKMQRFVLTSVDTAHLEFSDKNVAQDFVISILVVEDAPTISIKRSGKEIFSDRLKSVDDLKIFLEERFYQHLK